MIFRKLALKEKIFYETTLIYTHIEATYIYKVYTHIYIYTLLYYTTLKCTSCWCSVRC